ncbi:MAG: DUF1415 domain-containing protein [Burkholderiaceae bacterium]|nr:DUF1415 domain-containing protein [Burkholderiaceae bacterium]
MAASPDASVAAAETLAWVDRAVIGLNLCPFARAVRVKGQIRCVVSDAADIETLLRALCGEAQRLLDTDPTQCETTLLVHPQVLTDFGDYNDFLDIAEAALEELGCDGVLQLASFHPDYQFAGTEPDDVTNATNRSPYPTLHLLREESLDRAVQAFPEAEAIYETNIATMEALGTAGWQLLASSCRDDAVAQAAGAPTAAIRTTKPE